MNVNDSTNAEQEVLSPLNRKRIVRKLFSLVEPPNSQVAVGRGVLTAPQQERHAWHVRGALRTARPAWRFTTVRCARRFSLCVIKLVAIVLSAWAARTAESRLAGASHSCVSPKGLQQTSPGQRPGFVVPQIFPSPERAKQGDAICAALSGLDRF